jgi:S-adenosylhomocysteine hydrolase
LVFGRSLRTEASSAHPLRTVRATPHNQDVFAGTAALAAADNLLRPMTRSLKVVGSGPNTIVPNLFAPEQVHEADLFGRDLYSTATPIRAESLRAAAQPSFFRELVPAIKISAANGSRRWAQDSPALRAQATNVFAELLARFSPVSSLANAKPIDAPKMPVLEAAREGVRRDHFAEHELIAVQHLYASTVGLVDALHEHGIDYRHATVIGKSYSTCYGAARALADRGVEVPVTSLEQSADEDHEHVMERTIVAALTKYEADLARGIARPKLLLLDDGGQLIDLVHRRFPQLLPRVTAVEQTTRGLNRIAKLEQLGCAVANVAAAPLKIDNEMPQVGHSIFWEVIRKLTVLEDAGIGPPKTISLNGLGAVGMSLARACQRNGFAVRLYDELFDLFPPEDFGQSKNGIELIRDRREFLRGAEALVSLTGAAPIRLEDYAHLPNNAALFNGASSNDEMDAARAVEAARMNQPPRRWWAPAWRKDKTAYLRGMPELMRDREHVLPSTGWVWGELSGAIVPLGHVARRAQRDRVLHFANKDIFLASSGFVVNLTDDPDPIPAKYIQPTRAALFIGCVEAVEKAAEHRVFALSPERQETPQAIYDREVGAEKQDPQWVPDWLRRMPGDATLSPSHLLPRR